MTPSKRTEENSGPPLTNDDFDHDGTTGFWARYEHQWLPVLVMGLALLIVAFAPLAWYPLGS